MNTNFCWIAANALDLGARCENESGIGTQVWLFETIIAVKPIHICFFSAIAIEQKYN